MNYWGTYESSSGSGAVWYGEDTSIQDVFMSSIHEEKDDEILMADSESMASYQLPPGVAMTPKNHPGYDDESS